MKGFLVCCCCLVLPAVQNIAAQLYGPEQGINPQSYAEGDLVELKVNKLTSTQTLYPIDYNALPFCQAGVEIENENWGQDLAGDRIRSSPYQLRMKVDAYCEQLCIVHLGRAEANGLTNNRMVKAIHQNYHHNWIVDNLPAASKMESDQYFIVHYSKGIPMGFAAQDTNLAYINNHVNIEIMYHQDEQAPGTYRVVRFVVQPFSIFHEFEALDPLDITDDGNLSPKVARIKNPIESCKTGATTHTTYDMVTDWSDRRQLADGPTLFTYDVVWTERNDIQWASRWDIYLSMDNLIPAMVHWFSIVNSLATVTVLSSLIALILIRILRRDRSRGNRVAIEYTSGWKTVHADVFRPPSFSPLLLAIGCGTGAQLLCTAMSIISVLAMGFMSSARRGHLLMGTIISFSLMGFANGFVSARFYKTFNGANRLRVKLLSAWAFPGACFAVFMLVDLMATTEDSTHAVPTAAIMILLLLWFGVSTPLVFLGAYFGFRQEAISSPVETSSFCRQIPPQPRYMAVPFTLFCGGILPFLVCYVELFYIMTSAWMGAFFHYYGFLLLVFAIMLLVCAEIAVVLTFLQLRKENYHWWWRSFSNTGATGIWVLLYSCVYSTHLQGEQMPTHVLYFGYMGLISLALFLVMGFVGLSASLCFNKFIYAFITVDDIDGEMGNETSGLSLLSLQLEGLSTPFLPGSD